MTDIELAIKLLPRLHARDIATDLDFDGTSGCWFLACKTSHAAMVSLSDSQAIAYIVGCMVLRKREAQDGSAPGDVLSCNDRVLSELGIIDKETSE